MGAWGPGIFSDDVACYVKDYYMNCLREEMCADEAERAVASYFSEELADDDDGPVVILALADAAWSVGRLSENLKNAAIEIIDTGEGLDRWEEDKRLLKKRQDVLSKLKDKLLSEQPPKKKIHKKIYYTCPWKDGDVFAYKIEGELSKKNKLYGKYIIFQKIGEILQKDSCLETDGHICPIVRCWISDVSIYNDNSEDEPRFIKSSKKPGSKKNKYAFVLLTYSKRQVPKKLKYLGNYNVCIIEDDIGDIENPANHFDIIWKNFEDSIIKRYNL